MAGGDILAFEGVTVGPQPGHESGLSAVSFVLRPGDLLLACGEAGQPRIPLADAAEGLLDLEAGAVRFLGEDWAGVTAERAADLRGRIGRVFEEHGWISNLDMDENITLAQRHHTARPEAEIEAEALAVARGFGLADLPRMRPAVLKRGDLRMAEWVRAFIGAPALVLLENPTRDVYGEAVGRLAQAVAAVRERGGAVMVLTEDERLRQSLGPAASLRFDVSGAGLVPREGG